MPVPAKLEDTLCMNIPQNAEEFVFKIARLILTANCEFVFHQFSAFNPCQVCESKQQF